METSTELRNLLHRIDHKGYPAYKDTKGTYQFQGYVLSIDHVQGDPFASPSKVSVHMKGKMAGFPRELYCGDCQRRALQDYLTRQFHRAAESYAFKAKGSGKSGLISISRCGQEVLERTAFWMDDKTGDIVVRLEIGFPANGRTINARELEKILFDFLPDCVERSLYYRTCDKKKVRGAIDLAEDQEYIRGQLEVQGLTAFVANGSILPRESGISPRPMKGAVSFRSPKELEVTMELPYKGKICGMGIPKGVTLIVGGGYHGKSTLLNMIGTLEAVDKGDIRLYGRKLPGINSRKATMLRRNTINYLFQSFALISDMTVFQNLLLSMRFLHLRQREKEKRIHQILQTVGLSHLEYAVVNTLSGGEQQRVGIARALSHNPDILIADEPTGNLDTQNSDEVIALLKKTSKCYAQTIIMITHNRSIASTADRVLQVSDGVLTDFGRCTV